MIYAQGGGGNTWNGSGWMEKPNKDVVKQDTSGKVAIGLQTPTEKLDVAGHLRIRGLQGNGLSMLFVDSDGKLMRGEPFPLPQKPVGPDPGLGACPLMLQGNGVFTPQTPRWVSKESTPSDPPVLFTCPKLTRVGIGTDSPSEKLHIAGISPAIRFEDNHIQTGTSEKTDFIISADNGSARLISNQSVNVFINGDNNDTNRFFSVIDNSTFFGGTAITLFKTYENGDSYIKGNLGIGTDPSNAYKLTVCGQIKAQKLRLETWSCDFVFDDDYKLMSIPELSQYIQKNNHLPLIPDARQVENEGVEVGDMQSLLLQKVEELTLYIIEQHKRMTLLEESNTLLKTQMEQLMQK